MRGGAAPGWRAFNTTLPRFDLLAQLERSEEHTSELQSHLNLVCRLLLEKKKGENVLKFAKKQSMDSLADNESTYSPESEVHSPLRANCHYRLSIVLMLAIVRGLVVVGRT